MAVVRAVVVSGGSHPLYNLTKLTEKETHTLRKQCAVLGGSWIPVPGLDLPRVCGHYDVLMEAASQELRDVRSLSRLVPLEPGELLGREAFFFFFSPGAFNTPVRPDVYKWRA